jgi:hypothetical protein
MVKKLFLALLLVACAGGDEWAETEELGELEEPFRGKNTPSFQYGTQTGGDKAKCNKTSTGQVCSIPAQRNWTYCIQSSPGGSGFSGAVRTRIESDLTALDTSLGTLGWDIVNDGDILFGSCCDTCTLSGQPPKIVILNANVGASGSASNDVKDYAAVSFGGTQALTEGSGVVGQYQSHSKCTISINETDILAKGTNATQDNNGVDHALLHGMMACLGIGARTTSSGLASRRLFQPSTTATNVSTGESCQLNEHTLSDPGQYNLKTPQCSSD